MLHHSSDHTLTTQGEKTSILSKDVLGEIPSFVCVIFYNQHFIPVYRFVIVGTGTLAPCLVLLNIVLHGN